MIVRSCLVSLLIAAVTASCSSVPDVEFVPDGTVASDSGGPGVADGGSSDGAASTDGSTPRDSGADTCTKPSRDDICCGKTLCSGGCSVDDCADCVADCGSQGEICCRKGNAIQCRRPEVGCR